MKHPQFEVLNLSMELLSSRVPAQWSSASQMWYGAMVALSWAACSLIEFLPLDGPLQYCCCLLRLSSG